MPILERKKGVTLSFHFKKIEKEENINKEMKNIRSEANEIAKQEISRENQ